MRAGASLLAGKFLSENLTVHDALSFSPASYVVVIASKRLLSRVSLGFLFDLLTFLCFFVSVVRTKGAISRFRQSPV